MKKILFAVLGMTIIAEAGANSCPERDSTSIAGPGRRTTVAIGGIKSVIGTGLGIGDFPDARLVVSRFGPTEDGHQAYTFLDCAGNVHAPNNCPAGTIVFDTVTGVMYSCGRQPEVNFGAVFNPLRDNMVNRWGRSNQTCSLPNVLTLEESGNFLGYRGGTRFRLYSSNSRFSCASPQTPVPPPPPPQLPPLCDGANQTLAAQFAEWGPPMLQQNNPVIREMRSVGPAAGGFQCRYYVCNVAAGFSVGANGRCAQAGTTPPPPPPPPEPEPVPIDQRVTNCHTAGNLNLIGAGRSAFNPNQSQPNGRCVCAPDAARAAGWSRPSPVGRLYGSWGPNNTGFGLWCRTRAEVCAMPNRPQFVWDPHGGANGLGVQINTNTFNCGAPVPPEPTPEPEPEPGPVPPINNGFDFNDCVRRPNGTYIRITSVALLNVYNVMAGATRADSARCDGAVPPPPPEPEPEPPVNWDALDAAIAQAENGFNLDRWRAADGRFNWTRFTIVGAGATAVGVTAGALTNRAIRNHQLRSGYESIQCVAGHGTTAFFGEVFIVR